MEVHVDRTSIVLCVLYVETTQWLKGNNYLTSEQLVITWKAGLARVYLVDLSVFNTMLRHPKAGEPCTITFCCYNYLQNCFWVLGTEKQTLPIFVVSVKIIRVL